MTFELPCLTLVIKGKLLYQFAQETAKFTAINSVSKLQSSLVKNYLELAYFLRGLYNIFHKITLHYKHEIKSSYLTAINDTGKRWTVVENIWDVQKCTTELGMKGELRSTGILYATLNCINYLSSPTIFFFSVCLILIYLSWLKKQEKVKKLRYDLWPHLEITCNIKLFLGKKNRDIQEIWFWNNF